MIRNEDHNGEKETKKAIIISVSEYNNNDLLPLDFCRKNGEDMYEVLTSLGYEIEKK